MAQTGCHRCPQLDVMWQKRGTNNWQQVQAGLDDIDITRVKDASDLLNFEFDIGIIKAKADQVRECHRCRRYFTQAFQIPNLWWKAYCRNSNGYFGCEDTTDGFNTWARFLIKHLKEDKINYEWYKLNVFVRWLFSSKQIVLIIFDPPPPIIERLPSPLLDEPDDKHLEDPFWIYTPLIEEVVRLQDQAVWAIRNQVRAVEREKMSATKPKPNYRLLHDISRHEIHVSETLGIAINTINSILENHKDFMASNLSVDATSNSPSKRIHQRLLFHKHMLDSLCHRSSSNKERLMNEIQLAFNTVAQYDSGISVEIGRAAQIDSAAMKTISFLTLTFLPATFTSTIFSMSFFNYSPDSRSWTVSGKFWIYWAVAIPLTVAASVVWYYWHKVFPPTLIGEEKRDEATLKSYC